MSEPQKIHAAMIAVMRKCPVIGKDSKNTHQGFNFRGIDACYQALHGLLADEGIITLPFIKDVHTENLTDKNGKPVNRTLTTVGYRFMAEDGSSVEASMVGEGMDHGDKSGSKSVAIAHKYLLLQTFLIPTDEIKDPDHDSYEIAAREERREQEARQVASRGTKPRPIPGRTAADEERSPHLDDIP